MVDLGFLGLDTGDMTSTLDATFAALSDPTRRAILSMLLEDDMAFTDDPAAIAYREDVRTTFEAVKTVLANLAAGEKANADALARIAAAAKP